MTPAYISGSNYVSFGGAGFVYPSNARAARGYAEGDTVRVLCDFSANVISFFVNGEAVKEVALSRDIDDVFPSISCERGGIVAEVRFEL